MSSGSAPPAGRDSFAFSSLVFIRLLALIHLIAFASAWTQISGLIGVHGIAPAGLYLEAAHQQLGRAAYVELPTLCWIFGTKAFLPVLCAAGVALSVLLFAGIAPWLCLLLLWADYLSLVNVGQMFWAFQWDGLLLEATLLAVFAVPWRWRPLWRLEEPPPLARLLLWWLLFRLMFLAGVVKLSSGDPSWRDLTALTFHFETQPLPTPLAWYAQQAPVWWHKLECALMFAIELGVPFLLFTTRTLRHVAALVLAAFMAAIALTGNYTFFNALAIALCLFCLDDAWWRRVMRVPENGGAVARPRLGMDTIPAPAEPKSADTYPLTPRKPLRLPTTWRGKLTLGFAIFTFGYTASLTIMSLAPFLGPPPGFRALARLIEPLRSFNNYGLFAVMTHPRPELIVEGSYDGQDWHAYEFPAKPGALAARPKFVAPHQPRLDWQLWFAALESPEQNPWVLSLCEHLLRGTPAVLRLLAKNPFPERPPKYIRIVRYEYHFTDVATRTKTGHWWRRTPMDIYLGPVALR